MHSSLLLTLLVTSLLLPLKAHSQKAEPKAPPKAAAENKLDAKLEAGIIDACLINAKKNKSLKDPARLCECIARKYFESARQEEDKTKSAQELNWALSFYSAKSEKERADLAKKMDYMAEFDLQAAEECAQPSGDSQIRKVKKDGSESDAGGYSHSDK